MATYSAITSGQIDAESYIDTTLAGQWTNNVLAMFEGDASASSVRLQTAAIEAAAVTRAKITTATVTSLAGNVPISNTVVDIALSPYCFFPMIHTDDSGSSNCMLCGHTTDGADPDLPRFGVKNSDGTDAGTYDVEYRYIDA